MAEYNNYQDALEHETINKLKAEVKELESRRKLEQSLNTLAVFAILGIVATIVILGIILFGGVATYSR